jgi:hypothetical protein
MLSLSVLLERMGQRCSSVLSKAGEASQALSWLDEYL